MVNFQVGQLSQRVVAILLAVCLAGFYFLLPKGFLSIWVYIVTGIAFFLFFLMSIPPLYRLWLHFSERLSIWIIRIMFSVIYLMLVPILLIFSTRDRLRIKRQRESTSFWVKKEECQESLDDLRRMG